MLSKIDSKEGRDGVAAVVVMDISLSLSASSLFERGNKNWAGLIKKMS